MYTSDNDGTEKRILLFVLVDIGDWISDIGGVRRESWRAWIKRGEFWVGYSEWGWECSRRQVQYKYKTSSRQRGSTAVLYLYKEEFGTGKRGGTIQMQRGCDVVDGRSSILYTLYTLFVMYVMYVMYYLAKLINLLIHSFIS